jgi:hypothetical protein
VKAAQKTDKAMRDLIAESGGVFGLHLNGDDAPWDSLLRGGQFDDWLDCLTDLNISLVALDKLDAEGGL